MERLDGPERRATFINESEEPEIRIQVYAEEITDRVEIVERQVGDDLFIGCRFHLELPCHVPLPQGGRAIMKGPHGDDWSAVTLWTTTRKSPHDLRDVLRKALVLLDEHYAMRNGQT